MPNQIKKAPAPLVHAVTPEMRRALRRAYFSFLTAYQHRPRPPAPVRSAGGRVPRRSLPPSPSGATRSQKRLATPARARRRLGTGGATEPPRWPKARRRSATAGSGSIFLPTAVASLPTQCLVRLDSVACRCQRRRGSAHPSRTSASQGRNPSRPLPLDKKALQKTAGTFSRKTLAPSPHLSPWKTAGTFSAAPSPHLLPAPSPSQIRLSRSSSTIEGDSSARLGCGCRFGRRCGCWCSRRRGLRARRRRHG